MIIAYWLRIRTVAKLGPKGVQTEHANISVAIETSTILPTFKREKIALAHLSITMQAISSRCAPCHLKLAFRVLISNTKAVPPNNLGDLHRNNT